MLKQVSKETSSIVTECLIILWQKLSTYARVNRQAEMSDCNSNLKAPENGTKQI